jgi:hypothetical protein
MALTQVTGPYPIFTDLDGTPLDDGYLYIGEINEDPQTNPIQVYWDSALTIVATQPIRTSNGYAYRNGSPALLYTAGEFSITIRNKRQEFVLYSPLGYGFDPAAVSGSVVKNDFVGNGSTVNFTLSATPSTVLATNVFINGVYQEKDSYSLLGNVVTFSNAPPLSSSIEIMTYETGVINSGNANNISYTATLPGATAQTVQTKLEQYVSVKDFGAVGDGVADDTTEIQAALNSGAKFVTLDEGTFVFSAITIPSGVILQGAGKGATILSSTSTGSAITLQNITDAGLSNLRIAAPSATRVIHVISTSTFVMRPLFENIFISAFASAGIGIFFDVQGANPIYFPRMYNLDIDGGTFAPTVGTRIGIAYGGAGSTITVGPSIFGARITNTLQGITHSKVDTALGFGVQLDAQTNGSLAGVGLLFASGGGGYNKYWGTRFEGSAVDTFIAFNAGSADNFVEGVFGGAASSKITDAGVRNSWSGADGSGGLIDNAASIVNFQGGVKLGSGTTLQNYATNTFTPTVFGGTTAGTATYAYQVGEYTRIGNKVFFSLAISFSGHTGTGSLNVGALPFTAATRTNIRWNQTLNMQNIAYTGPVLVSSVSSASNFVQCSQIATTGTTSAVPIAASGFVSVTGFYEV